jgi:hypothetical protein
MSGTEVAMNSCLFALFVLLAPPVLAQQSVPEIAFDSVPDFLKLPPGMNFGEVPGVAVNSRGHVFVFTRSNSAGGPAYAPSAAQLLEFGPKGEFLREIGGSHSAWSFAHTVLRIDKDETSGHRQGLDAIIKFSRRAASSGCSDAERISRRGYQTLGAREPASPGRGRAVSPADRRRVGFRRQHLHHRRIYQLARRQI